MNFHTFGILVSLHIICTLSAPTKNEVVNVYEKLVDLGNEEGYKCPYLRKTLLLTPEPDFLKYCLIPEEAKNSKEFSPILTAFTLCMVYFESFKKMCAVASKMSPDESKFLLSDSVLNSSLPIQDTCESIKNGKPVDIEYKHAFELMDDENLCRRLCLDGNNKTTQLCEWSAYLLNMAVKFEKVQIPVKPVVTVETARILGNGRIAVQTESNKAAKFESLVVNTGTIKVTKSEPPPVVNAGIEVSKSESKLETKMSNLVVKPENVQSVPAPRIQAVKETEGVAPERISTRVSETNRDIETTNEQADKQSDDLPAGGEVTLPKSEEDVKDGVEKTDGGVAGTDKPDDGAAGNAEVKDGAAGNAEVNNGAVGNAEVKDASAAEEDVGVSPVDQQQPPGEGAPPGEQDAGEKTQVLPQNTEVGQVMELGDEKAADDNKKASYDDDEEDEPDYSAPNAAAKPKDKPPAEKSKPRELEDDKMGFPDSYSNQTVEEDDSYFFSYFMMICIVFVLGYVGYHNKQKILAIVLEGRKGKRQQRRRPNSANYHKLDSNLEEAVTSSCNKNTANVIY